MTYEIIQDGYSEINVEGSTFIGMANFYRNSADLHSFLKKLKKEHPKARHICYAYKIGDEVKFSDDGEPSGTAGKPILNLIEHKNLENVGIFVIRYFGGKLLGSGRLLRTYNEASKLAIENAMLCQVVIEQSVLIDIDYEIYDQLTYFCKKKQLDIIKINFNDTINITFYAPLDFDIKELDVFYGKLKVIKTKFERHRK